MRGSVRKRGSTWAYVVDVGKKSDGRRDQRKKGGFRTRRDAQEALNAVLKQVQENTYVAPTKQTVGEFFERWLPSIRHSVKPRTFEGYAFLARKYVLPNLGGLRLTALTHVRLNTFYADLLEKGGMNGKPLSRKTVRNVHILVRRALKDAPLLVNPAAKASAPRPAQREMLVWDQQTLQGFLGRAKAHKDYVGWLLLAATGMRRGEVLGLKWSDVDFQRGTLSVADSKTAAGRRLVSLDSGTVQALREWRMQRMGTVHVLTKPDGSPLRAQAFTERFRARVRAWNFPLIRLHDLRHTHATLLLKAGVHPKVVQERLGHSSIQVTLDIYSHVSEGLQEAAASTVGGLLWNAN
jgi:integrase